MRLEVEQARRDYDRLLQKSADCMQPAFLWQQYHHDYPADMVKLTTARGQILREADAKTSHRCQFVTGGAHSTAIHYRVPQPPSLDT